jgi:putative membrane protein
MDSQNTDLARGDDPGREPDYRFTLANERTFLAWIRTSFGLLAGGVAVNQLVTRSPAHAVIGLACLLLATTLAAGAYTHWRRAQTAIRHDRPLPVSPLIPLVAVASSAIAVVAALSVVLA